MPQPTEQPTQTVLVMLDLGFLAAVGAHAVDQGAGGADLDAGAAGNAGAFAQRGAEIGDQEGARAAFFEAEGEIAHQFAAGAHAAPAEDAAVVVQDEIRDARHPPRRAASWADSGQWVMPSS